MDYKCAYYWHREDGRSTLVLKQLVFQQGELPVVFGCLALEGSPFVEAVTEWFYEKGLTLCQRGEEGVSQIEDSLAKKLATVSGRQDVAAVLLCVGRYFVLWGKNSRTANEGVGIWLLNNRFGRPHCGCLFSRKNGQAEEIVSGVLEEEVGILLSTEALFKGVPEEEIIRCLAVKELRQEARVRKRLTELGEAAVRKGEKHPAAMLIVTC